MSGVETILSYRAVIEELAKKVDCDWTLLAGQLMQESSGDSAAVGAAGELGLAQMKLSTAHDYWLFRLFTRDDLLRPDVNLAVWMTHMVRLRFWLLRLRPQFDVWLLLAAYNWGMGNLGAHLADGGTYDTLPDVVKLYVEKCEEKAGLFCESANERVSERDCANLRADNERLRAACRAAVEWTGMDGDGIDNPVLTQLKDALDSLPSGERE